MKHEYIPSVTTVFQETDPAKVHQARKLAQQNLDRPTPALLFPTEPAADGAATAPASLPSPWVKTKPPVTAEVLPSAMGPVSNAAALVVAREALPGVPVRWGKPRSRATLVLLTLLAAALLTVVSLALPWSLGWRKPTSSSSSPTASFPAMAPGPGTPTPPAATPAVLPAVLPAALPSLTAEPSTPLAPLPAATPASRPNSANPRAPASAVAGAGTTPTVDSSVPQPAVPSSDAGSSKTDPSGDIW